jgi:hypothetical protein
VEKGGIRNLGKTAENEKEGKGRGPKNKKKERKNREPRGNEGRIKK